MSQLNTIVVTVGLSKTALNQLQQLFKTVHYHPDFNVPKEVAKEADVWFNPYFTISEGLTYDDIPKTKLIQLSAAGANYALSQPLFKENAKAREEIALCTTSGMHVFTIPQYVIQQAISLYMFTHQKSHFMKTTKTWPGKMDAFEHASPAKYHLSDPLGCRTLYGKTAGLLGYGHIARETARLLKAFNVEIIAANSAGAAKKDTGYVVEGTGDVDGTIPSAYYSTNNPKAFKEFLSRSDILIASLPSTPATQFMLKAEHFDALPKGAIFINVGRGDLVKSEVLLEALDKGSLWGAGLDVSDPEPLPDHHPLFSHPQVVLTPHTSGQMEGYDDKACDMLIANIKGIREGKIPMNRVDLEKGY